MNTIAMDRRLLPQPEAKPRRPKSVRPRFKGMYRAHTPEKGPHNLLTLSPPAVGGTMDLLCRDNDGHLADTYAQEGHPLAMLVRLRLEAARQVEALLAFLDATEGDIDLADEAEPTLDAIQAAVRLCDGAQEDDEDGADHEPSLCGTGADCHPTGPYLMDGEQEADDEEHEPSGIADVDGLIEQGGYVTCNAMICETLGDAIAADARVLR